MKNGDLNKTSGQNNKVEQSNKDNANNSWQTNTSSISDVLTLKPELIGFQITFLLMLFVPILGFFLTKCMYICYLYLL